MITLRPLHLGDLEWTRELRNENKKYFLDQTDISAGKQREWFEYQEHKRNFDFFVIESEGEPVGTISVSQLKNCCEIGNVLIKSEWRHKGVLTEALKLIFHQYNAPFKLEVLVDNEVAIEAYESFGFIKKLYILWKM